MSSKYFTVRGKDYDEVRRKILVEYGDRAQIVSWKDVPVGGFMGLFTKNQVECSGYLSTGRKMGGARDLPAKDEDSKKAILNMVGKDETLTSIMADIQDIKQHMVAPRELPPHPSIQKVEEILEENDFSRRYIQELSDKLKREFALDDLDNWPMVQQAVVEWIFSSVPQASEELPRSPEVLVLVGPTGVGKTTTIAKLAALKAISSNGAQDRRVCIITIDSYRIGAKAQIQTYGDIMDIPVYLADSYQELRKYITLHQEYDLILVDTIGKSPKDFKHLGEMRETLEACGQNAQFHLAMSSTTKTGDLQEILRQFEFFNYRSVVLTKLDETSRVGNLISILAQKKIPLSYVTNGQSVPSDILSKDIPLYLVDRLQGLEFNRQKLIKKTAQGGVERWK